MPPLVWWLAQAAPPPDGGLSPLTQVMIAMLGGGVAVALIDWLRRRGQDRATESLTEAQTEQIATQSRSIAEDLNVTIWERTQKELARADKNLEAEREARRAVEQRAAHLERELEELHQRVRQMEQRAHDEQSTAYAALLEAIPDAVVQAGQYGLIKAVNAAAMALFGYERDEMVGQPLTMLMPNRYRPAHRTGFAEALVTRKGPLLDSDVPVRVNALHANGHEFQVALRLSMQAMCFTAVIRPYLDRDGGELPLVDFE